MDFGNLNFIFYRIFPDYKFKEFKKKKSEVQKYNKTFKILTVLKTSSIRKLQICLRIC